MSDYISREAAFNGILKLVPKVDNDGYCWVIRGDAATAIESIPAADVRPVVRGKWNWENNPSYSPFDGSSEYIYRCNQCGENNDRDSAFCPNCGADMREEHKE